MPVTLFGEVVLLFQMACVVFLFAYLLSKSRFYTQVLEHRATLATQVFLAIVFGLLSVYGMSSDLSFYTATMNIRDFGPIAAGLACGPYIGLGAGIIGFIYRLSIGGTNVYTAAIGPLAAGIIGGLVYYYSNRNLVSVKVAVIITLIVESLISTIAIVVRILEGDSVVDVMTVTVNVALPMIIMTSIAVGVFCFILHNQIRERQVQTEKMQLELEVESKRNLSTIINTIANPVYVLDRDHRFVLVNDSLCRFFGQQREEILGKNHRDFYNPFDAERHWVWVDTAFRTYAPREEEVTITKPDGQVCTIISTSTMYTDASGQEFIVGVIQDITERKKMEVILAENEAWYRILFEHTGVATIIINEDGTIDQANTEFTQLTGYSREECEGKLNWTHFVHPDDLERIIKFHHERRNDQTPVPTNYMVRMHDRSGVVKTLRAVVTLIPGTKKSIASYVDISEQKRSEEALVQMNRKLNLLSSITRHDITNQATVLMGYLYILEKKQPDPSFHEYFRKVATAAQRISTMIQFTKEYKKIGINVPVWQECRTLITTAAMQASLGQVIVKNDIPAGTEVFADPLIVKVFFNLMDNAARYGGKITTIRFSFEERDGDHVMVCEDDGDGIIAEKKERIFERGFGKNTGLGLALSQEILSITGITIRETGEPGKGARFEMTVPKGAYRFTSTGKE
ncbi:MAG: PAS domain S-box protein [Methanoregula sp.]